MMKMLPHCGFLCTYGWSSCRCSFEKLSQSAWTTRTVRAKPIDIREQSIWLADAAISLFVAIQSTPTA
jgi:hypothetical protein